MAITIKPVRGEIEPQSIGSRSTTTFLDSAKSNAIDFNKTQRIVSNEMIRIKNKTTKYDSLMSIDVTNFNQKLKEGDKNGDAFDKETLDNLVDKQFEISLNGNTRFERLLHLIHFGDWVSLWCAYLHNTDPSPVEKIANLKNELSKF